MPPARLWAGDLVVDHSDDTLTVSLRLEWDGSAARNAPTQDRLCIAVSDLDRLGGDRRHLLAAHTPPNATPLVPILAVIAAASGADLTIDAPVCPAAMAGARRGVSVGEVVHGWTGITLGATAGTTTSRQRGGTGFVFALGFEPLAQLVALRRLGTVPSHLIALDDHTLATAGWTSPARHGAGTTAADVDCRRWRAEAMAANAARLPMVRVSTNAHVFLARSRIDATARHAVVSACGLALGGVVDTVVVPTGPADDARSPDTTGLWSSGTVEVTSPDPTMTLVEAAELVAGDPWARATLRVCASQGPGEGCGTCHPCQMALTHLWLAQVAVGMRHPSNAQADPARVRALHPAQVPDRGDQLAMIDTLTGIAGGSDHGSSSASPDERLLAGALADAWSTYLARCGTHPSAPALSA